jgi:acetyl esterase/lipase
MSIKPQALFTKEPVRREVNYPQAAGTGLADIYRIPDEEDRAAVLIFLGANAAGRDDKDVVNLGNSLARAGFVVMFHWSPTMALRSNIDPVEIDNLVSAFQYLAAQEFVDQDRLGMGGFCVGASFALVAAADPRIRDDVVFVNAFGPYFDARDLLMQLASRSRIYQGNSELWDPDRLTLRVFANELIETLEDPRGQQALSRLFLEGQDVPEAELSDLPQEAQRVRQLLEGTTLEIAEGLYQDLPAEFRASMNHISPSAHVGDLKARIMILHDRNDRLVPSAESRRLADALEERGNYRYTEVLAFEHVRPASGGGLWQLVKEGIKLYQGRGQAISPYVRYHPRGRLTPLSAVATRISALGAGFSPSIGWPNYSEKARIY